MLVKPDTKSLIQCTAKVGEFADLDEAEAFIRETYPTARVIYVARHIERHDTLIIVAEER